MEVRRRRIAAALVVVILLAVVAVIAVPRIMSRFGEADPGAVGGSEGGQDQSRENGADTRIGQGADAGEQEMTTETDIEPVVEPREASVVSGTVGYDDIPEPSQIEGNYGTDEIRDAIVRYMQAEYPSDTISSIRLLGNGTSQSQEVDEMASYMCYLVTTDRNQDIGLFVQCSESEEPHVTEAEYLVVSPTLLYDVASKEYIPMGVPDGEEAVPSQDESPAPPEGGYPDPYALPEPGTEEDRMRRLPIPIENADPEKMGLQ